MNDTALSSDGAWRWDGERWVPNQPPPPPPPSQSVQAPPAQAPPAQAPPAQAPPAQAPQTQASAAQASPGQASSTSPGAISQDTSAGATRDPMLVPALVAGIVALLPLLVHLVGDTMDAFGHGPSGQPWWFDTWFIVLQFLLGTLALALAAVAALRNPSRLAAVVMAIAGGVFLQGVVVLYYRVIVTHFGYDIPF